MNSSIKLITVTLGLFSLFAVGGDIFNYSVKRYPAGNLNCLERAEQVADLMEEANDIEIYNVRCDRPATNRLSNMDFTISYIAEERLNIVSSTNTPYLPLSTPGTFRTQADCNAAKGVENALFEKSTGLKPVLSYCYRSELTLEKLPWGLRIDAFGQPEKLAIYRDTSVAGDIVDKSTVCAQMKENANNIDHPVAACAIGKGVFEEVRFRFYSEDDVHIWNERLVQTDSLENCQAQEKDAQALFLDVTSESLATFCVKRSYQNEYLYQHIFFERVELGKDSMEEYVDPKFHETFSGCRQNIGAMVTFYQYNLMKDVKGGLCGGTAGKYQIHLFGKRS